MALPPSYHSSILWKAKSYSPQQFQLYLEQSLSQKPESWEQDILSFTYDWMNDSKQIFSIQTSGSTGNPKTINISRQAMIDSALATGDFLHLKAGFSALLCLPVKYIAGKMMIVRSLVLGMDLHYVNPTINVIDSVKRSYDFCAMIPLQVQYAIDNKLSNELNSIENLIVGGAALSHKYMAPIQELTTKVFATYGMTETITHIALQKLNGIDRSDFFTCLTGISVEQDERECLTIKSASLANKQFITNDLAKLISPTEFQILGRIDFIINSGGLKINPILVEEKIAHLISVPFMIGYEEDAKFGQKIVLLVESGKALKNHQTLLQDIKNILPTNQAPKVIVNIPQLIMTDNKKIDRFKNNLFIKNYKGIR